MFKNNRTNAVDADSQRRPSTTTNEQNIECAQAMILENCTVTIAEITARLAINVARRWCKPLR
jgi:hypothetical protein